MVERADKGRERPDGLSYDPIPPDGVKEMTDEEFWGRCERTLPDGTHRSGVRNGKIRFPDPAWREPK